MKGRHQLTFLALVSAIFANVLLFSPIAPSALAATVPVAGVIICAVAGQVYMLGLYSMMASIRIQPITTRHALIVGVLSLVGFIAAFGCIYRYFGIEDALTSAISHNSSDCLYFSIVTWTTLGYGDFRPTSGVRLIAGAEALVGYVGMVGLIGIAGQYLVAKAGLSREEIDRFNKKLEKYEIDENGDARLRKSNKRGRK